MPRNKTKLLRKRKYSGYKATKKRSAGFTGGGNSKSTSSDICTKHNINDLLVGDFKPNASTSLSGSQKQFVSDIKKQATNIGKVASGNWLAGPGPPPAFPKCTIM